MSVKGDVFGLLGWLVIGAVITFFGLSLPSVGLVVLAIAVGVAAFASWRWALPWLIAGAALPVLWVAWRNRSGPGETCFSTPTVSGCAELLDPVPWLLSALAALAVSAALLVLGRRRGRPTWPPKLTTGA